VWGEEKRRRFVLSCWGVGTVGEWGSVAELQILGGYVSSMSWRYESNVVFVLCGGMVGGVKGREWILDFGKEGSWLLV
jgi:hypothetical protein